MKKIFLLLIIPLLIISCDNDDDRLTNTCSVSNPIEDFVWLKEIIADIEQSSLTDEFYISQAIYKAKTVFIVGNCCALCNTVLPVYNCEGKLISRLGCSEESINFSILNEDKII